jgi:hypothetical protein
MGWHEIRHLRAALSPSLSEVKGEGRGKRRILEFISQQGRKDGMVRYIAHSSSTFSKGAG